MKREVLAHEHRVQITVSSLQLFEIKNLAICSKKEKEKKEDLLKITTVPAGLGMGVRGVAGIKMVLQRQSHVHGGSLCVSDFIKCEL